MSLDFHKLEMVRRRGSNMIARCPACAAAEGDRKGDHLFVNEKGQFGCILHPGEKGHAHRQQIFALAGVREIPGRGMAIRKPCSVSTEPTVIKKNILGHLGRLHGSLPQEGLGIVKKKEVPQKELIPTVPSVPECISSDGCRSADSSHVDLPAYTADTMFNPREQDLLKNCPSETLDYIIRIKKVFTGSRVDRVISPEKEALKEAYAGY